MALPKLISQHRDWLWILAFGCIRGKQPASQKHRHAKMVEGVPSEVNGRQVFGHISAGRREIPLVHPGGALD